ncbi:MAG: TraM recognition domain-containing protein [Alphaproteobacteria bacterium]|nr:TraM recognition domain-containing protein [Alphaproteobacteria bacterium]
MSNNPDKNQELWMDRDILTRHCLGIAATGGGKSNFLNLQLKQQMMRGGGCIHIDGKNSKEAIIEFLNLARIHDRWHDVRIINIDDAELSNTYNPLLRGDADELTARIMAMIPEKGGENFFRSQAATALRAITGVLRAIDLPVNFDDLLTLMKSESAMRWLVQNGPKDSREYEQFLGWYNNMQEVDRRTGVNIVNEKKIQHSFGDLIGRLNPYNAGNAAQVLNAYNPEVDLYQAMQENLLVYVALPMLSKNEIATNFAKLFISDLRTAIGQIQNDKVKPAPTFSVFMDEFSSYAMPSLAPVFEQARSANVSLFPFVQTVSSLKDKERGLSEDFANKILGNTWSKISFVLKDPESCEVMSKIAGEQRTQSVSESVGEQISFSSGGDRDSTSMVRTGGRGRGYTKSISYDYEAIVRPEDFANLDTQKGEAIYIGKSEVLKLRVPYVQVPMLEYESDEEALDFPRFKMSHRRGLAIVDVSQYKS